MGEPEPRLLKPGEPKWWSRPQVILIGVVLVVVIIVVVLYRTLEV